MDRRSLTACLAAGVSRVTGGTHARAMLGRSHIPWGLLAFLVLPHCSAQHGSGGAQDEAQAVTSFQAGTYTIADGQSFAIDGGYYYWSKLTSEELYALTPGNTFQQWQFSPSGSGFTICNVGASGACLSDGGGSLQIGSNADVWSVTASGSGYALQDQKTGLYIVDAGSPADGAAVPTSSSAASWSIAPVGALFQAGTYYVSDPTSFAIDGGYYHFSQLTTEEVYSLTDGNTYQQWQFAASGSGFTICNVGDGSSVCLSDGGTTLAIGVATDVWTVAASGSGYTIQSQRTGGFIADASSPADGATVGISATASVWTLGTGGSGSGSGSSSGGSGSGSSSGSSSGGSSSGGGSGSNGFIATLDCASSSQQAICQYVSQNAQPKSAAATISTACQNPTNVVQANPGNFGTVTANATAGQTIVFAPGTYQGGVSVVSGVNYCGQGGDPTQVVVNNAGWAFYANGAASNVVIDGFTFGGGGLSLSNGGSNTYAQNNIFQKPAGNWLSAAVFLGGNSNTTIARNRFVCLPQSTGIATWSINNVVIADNSFSACDEGMHINYPGDTSNVRIARNTFVEGHRIQMELQSGTSGMVVEDNLVVFPYQGGYPDTYGMGISFAVPGTTSASYVRNNWLFGPVGNYQTLGVLALELAGVQTNVTGNVMQYWNSGTSISYDGPSMILTNNSYCNVLNFLTEDGGFNGWPGTDSGNTCVESGGGYSAPVP